MQQVLSRINPRKANSVPGCVFSACSSQLAEVFTEMFNLFLVQVVVPSSLKTPTMVSLPNIYSESSRYLLTALTPVVRKCFETIPAVLDPLQYAYRQNRFTEDAINATHHTFLTHLESKDVYTKLLFTDYRSALNTVVLQKLQQAWLLRTNITIGELSHRAVRVGNQTSGLRRSALKSSSLHSLHPRLYGLAALHQHHQIH